MSGKEDAPELTKTLQNLAINGAVLGGSAFFLARDLQGSERDQTVAEKEEALAKLQIAMGKDRVLPLAAFRGSVRPVIIAGSKGQVNKALAAAGPYQAELLKRGVAVVPVILSQDDPAERLRRLKADFGATG